MACEKIKVPEKTRLVPSPGRPEVVWSWWGLALPFLRTAGHWLGTNSQKSHQTYSSPQAESEKKQSTLVKTLLCKHFRTNLTSLSLRQEDSCSFEASVCVDVPWRPSGSQQRWPEWSSATGCWCPSGIRTTQAPQGHQAISTAQGWRQR